MAASKPAATPLVVHGEEFPSRSRRLVIGYSIAGAVLLVYGVSVAVRPPTSNITWLDGWSVDAYEVILASVCLARGVTHRASRNVAVPLALALFSWCAGDIAVTIESLGGKTPPMPSLADGFYLGFYPLAYIALLLFMRGEVRRLTMPSWLDGAVAGVGAAAVCAGFAFSDIARSTHAGPFGTTVNLAYPIGDVLLLALVIGGTAVLPANRKAPWILIAGACALNAIGDTFNLFARSFGHTVVGNLFNAIAWPGAFLLISLAVWLRPLRTDPLARQRPTGFLMPSVAAIAGLALLFFGNFRRLSDVAISLATVTLLLVGLRLALSARVMRQVTEQRHKQSMTDDLTGLGNRRFLTHILDTFFADLADPRLPRSQVAFLFLDLDHFKEINDSFGHSAGDELLRQLGPRLNHSLREGDILVRVGGDEFAVVLLDADARYARLIAERLMHCLEQPFKLEVVSATVGGSIGIALAPAHASNPNELLRCADIAMYRAKTGPGSIEAYDPDVDDDGDLLRLADELRVALEEHQFVLHFQPQLNLRTGDVTAVEALLRWPHPRLGMIPPLKFVPLAEEAGLMPALTAMVLNDALEHCSNWHRAGRQVGVSINVSPSNLLDKGFTAMIKEELESHDVDASFLVVEITETCVISDFERSQAIIAELGDMGVTVSIDDFGAGFTSLAHLGDLRVGELKLDRTFINGLRVPEKADLVRSTIELGHTLGLRVVAEGVEDTGTLALLGRFGCDLAQGYVISRPVPAADLMLETAWALDLTSDMMLPTLAGTIARSVPA